jgi:hypothetical protein
MRQYLVEHLERGLMVSEACDRLNGSDVTDDFKVHRFIVRVRSN